MMDKTKKNLAGILLFLDSKNVALEKVLIHKFAYFLDHKGLKLGFKFEPYTYGPFSYDIARAIGSMHFWEEVEEEKYEITVKDLTGYESLTEDQKSKLRECYEIFRNILEDDLSFEKLEVMGTILYCYDSLKMRKQPVEEANIIKEFIDWKQERYDATTIRAMLKQLQPHLN